MYTVPGHLHCMKGLPALYIGTKGVKDCFCVSIYTYIDSDYTLYIYRLLYYWLLALALHHDLFCE